MPALTYAPLGNAAMPPCAHRRPKTEHFTQTQPPLFRRILVLTRSLITTPQAVGAAVSLVLALTACSDDSIGTAPKTLKGGVASAVAGPGAKATGKIAFTNRVAYDQWLYVMNADGTDATRVSPTSYAYEADPTWAPDYKSILYIDYNAANALKRYTLANGRVDVVYSAPASITSPQYSPDGKKIAFALEFPGQGRDIYVVDADGKNLTQLTTDYYWDEHPTWSPDGKRIAFASWRSEGISKLYVMNADGSDQHVVHDCKYAGLPGHCTSPAWSPLAGDERIAYSVDAPGYQSLRIINADGTGDVQVIHDATVDDKQPAWSRDAKTLAFLSRIAGTFYPDVYTIDTNGTGLRQVTPAFGTAGSPAWAR
jgi:TolB protein